MTRNVANCLVSGRVLKFCDNFCSKLLDRSRSAHKVGEFEMSADFIDHMS